LTNDARSQSAAPIHDGGESRGVDFHGALGVGLSGGGVRAALYGLGVLIYMSRSGANEYVRVVTSVSGGSITNAAVALHGDFASGTMEAREAFETVAQQLAERVREEGTFLLPTWKQLARVFGILALFFIPVLPMAFVGWVEWSVVLGLAAIPMVGILVGTVLYPAMMRSSYQQETFQHVFRSFVSGPRRVRRESLKLANLPDSSVLHVMCATDLKSGQPFYFSKDWLFSPTYGVATTENVTLSEAVYSSAAFPVFYPPLRLSTADRSFRGGLHDGQRPRRLRLSDGGVSNNLGSEILDLLMQPVAPPWSDHPGNDAEPLITHALIVNASAPTIPKKRLWLNATRQFVVLYQNTLKPRLDSARRSDAHIILDIDASPADVICEQELAAGGEYGHASMRAQNLREDQEFASETFGSGLVADTSTVPTKLTPVGPTLGERLLQHGYYSACAALHVRFGFPVIPWDQTTSDDPQPISD